MKPKNTLGHSKALMEMRDRMRDFLDREAVPREHPDLMHDVERLDQVAHLFRERTKAAGLYAPQLPHRMGEV